MGDPFPREVFVVGVGMTAFGRHEGKTIQDLGPEAVRAALADAGLGYEAVETAYCGHVLQGTTAGQKVLYEIGMTGIPIFNVENACASGTSALRAAAMAVGHGIADVALACGFEVMGRGAIPTGGDERLARGAPAGVRRKTPVGARRAPPGVPPRSRRPRPAWRSRSSPGRSRCPGHRCTGNPAGKPHPGA